MARTKLEISKAEFQKVVTDLEASQVFDNPSYLWKAVEQTEWAQNLKPRPLTASVAYMRAKELGIVYNTKPGKLGREALESGVRKVRKAGSIKMRKFVDSFTKMRKEMPKRYHPLIERAEKGSKTACVKLKCLECANWQTSEVRKCVISSCPLFPIRPFQGKNDEEDIVQES